MLRTPMGGFINHSDKPNCVKVESVTRQRVNPLYDHDFKKWDLSTLRDIDPGEELTVKYTFYKLKLNPQEDWITGYNKWKKK